MSNDKKMHSTSHGHGLIFQCSDSRTRGLRSLHDAGLFQGTKELLHNTNHNLKFEGLSSYSLRVNFESFSTQTSY